MEAGGHGIITPNPWMILPFVALLGTIALAPLFFLSWWERHYPKIAYALGLLTLGYYLFGLHAYERVLHTGIEYVSFIALIGSLFVVSGGIHINVKGEATPLTNTLFLLVGAIIANVLGTTGASMLLIRPWIRMNAYRVTAHHVVFFIFIVSNVGGCLTPIGDPPLFLGYLKGIPFWWVLRHCWPIWIVGVSMLLALFYLVDLRNYRKAPKAVRQALVEPRDTWRLQGLGNLFFLGIILVSVFISEPLFLREALMLVAAMGSYYMTTKAIHKANDFDFHPIKEVAILFIGIFATMMPALDWLEGNAGSLDHISPAIFYWGTGLLSGVLDNAPTYLSFLSASFGIHVPADAVSQVTGLIQSGGTDLGTFSPQIQNTLTALQPLRAHGLVPTIDQIEVAYLLGNPELNRYIVAISIAAVFFGANTYIGNGPNFMVKSIAERNKVHTPSFLGYIFRFTIPFMTPVLIAVWWLFFTS